MLLPRRFPLSLLLALGLYLVLAARTVRQVGVVGEVELVGALGHPPRALTAVTPVPRWADGASPPSDGHRLGPLVASQVRPVERLVLGPVELPLLVNAYTGGLADWPDRLLWALTGSRALVQGLHIGLGAVLIALVHRFLRFRGTDVSAAVAALVLAGDWSFLFYKKVLGGTEILLQAAVLLCLWALWSRRWGGGRHGLLALGIGVGLGLGAKLTFLLSLAALLATALLMRWDRPRMKAPALDGLWGGLLAVVLLTLPLWIGGLHQALAVADPLPSHDFPALQARRVLSALEGSPSPAREGLHNLGDWLLEPLRFLGPAYGLEELPGASPGRLAGLVLVGLGIALGWRDRHDSPPEALLRFCSVFLLLQVGMLWLVARDLHHLAQATPTLAIVTGLALDRLAGIAAPPRSPARARLALALALPAILAGAWSLARTDALVRRVEVPTFTQDGQAALVQMLRDAQVQRLLVCDYETYGMIEIRAPEIEAIHGWPVAAREGPKVLGPLLAAGVDLGAQHLLLVKASQPMGYNLRPSAPQLEAAAAAQGLQVEALARLPGDAAVLYRLGRR